MSLEALMVATQKLGASMEALAALGAELRLRRDKLFAAPRLRQLLQEVVHGIDPKMLDGVTADQEQAALAIIEGFFRQAVDLLENPARAPGWTHADPAVLHGQGLASRRFIRVIEVLASRQADLKEALQRPGVLLDVGTGVGWLAIEVARSWPAWKVVGIDRYEPALSLARKNVAASGFEQRIELRAQSVEQLEDEGAFTLAWIPSPFLPPEIITAALERVRRALVPGGWVVFAVMMPPACLWGEALTALKVVRNGGHPWKTEEVENKLLRMGFDQIEASPAAGTTLIVGRTKSAERRC